MLVERPDLCSNWKTPVAMHVNAAYLGEKEFVNDNENGDQKVRYNDSTHSTVLV